MEKNNNALKTTHYKAWLFTQELSPLATRAYKLEFCVEEVPHCTRETEKKSNSNSNKRNNNKGIASKSTIV